MTVLNWGKAVRCHNSCLIINVDNVVREVNGRVLWRGLSLMMSHDRRLELNEFLFADVTAPAADCHSTSSTSGC